MKFNLRKNSEENIVNDAMRAVHSLSSYSQAGDN